MSVYRKFKTSKSAELSGVTIDYGDGTKIRVARAGGSNRAYLSALEKISRKHRRQIQLDILPEDVAARITRELYVDTVVLGWEGVTDADGQPLEFTRDNALKVFEDLPDLFRDVQEHATSLALFRDEVLEGDAKNSSTSSSISSTGGRTNVG